MKSFFFHALCIVASVQAAPQVGPTPPSSSVSAAPTPSANGTTIPLTEGERDELFDLHEQLVDIPSISRNETECAEFVNEYLTDLGYYVEKINVGPGRFNVFAYPQELKNQSVWPEVLITSHIDTVSTRTTRASRWRQELTRIGCTFYSL